MNAIRLLHLYPRELGINGDVGNMLALRRRAEWRGAPVALLAHDVGDPLPESVDLIHIGSGPVSAQRLVHEDLLQIAPRLRSWRDEGVPMLAVAGGWQLLGRSLTLDDGATLAGADVVPTSALLEGERVVGEVWRDDVAGFENHGARTLLDDGSAAPWPVARFGSVIATTLHGPFLPMNPTFADELLENAARRAEVVLGAPDDRITRIDDAAARSREAIRRRPHSR